MLYFPPRCFTERIVYRVFTWTCPSAALPAAAACRGAAAPPPPPPAAAWARRCSWPAGARGGRLSAATAACWQPGRRLAVAPEAAPAQTACLPPQPRAPRMPQQPRAARLPRPPLPLATAPVPAPPPPLSRAAAAAPPPPPGAQQRRAPRQPARLTQRGVAPPPPPRQLQQRPQRLGPTRRPSAPPQAEAEHAAAARNAPPRCIGTPVRA